MLTGIYLASQLDKNSIRGASPQPGEIALDTLEKVKKYKLKIRSLSEQTVSAM